MANITHLENNRQKTPEIARKNYHDTSFKKDIVPLKWFQDLNYNFTLQDMYTHLIKLSSKGLIFILHDILPDNIAIYIIQTPLELTQKQKQFFEENYSYFQNLFTKENTIFNAMAFQDNKNVWPQSITNINDFL